MKNRRRAFTIVEIMVCAALVAVVFAAVNSGLFTGRKAAEKGLNYLDRLGKINRLLEHCKRAVRFATKITPSNGPGNSRLYQIKYIERVKAPGLTRIENEMKIKAKPVKNGTTVIVKYKDKKTTYQLKDLEFFMELDKNLATIALSPTKGKRPPIALSLFAPFLNQVSLPPMMGVTGAGVPPLTATNSTSGNNSTTPPITSSGNMDGVIEPANANDGTDKSHSEDDNPGDMLGQSSVFGGSNNQSSTTVDGVDVSNIQFTSVSTTFNPTSRSGTRSGSNRPGNPSHETSDVQVNTMSTSATPPANDEILGMDGWSNALGSQVTATSLAADSRPPADEDEGGDDEENEGGQGERRRPPVRVSPPIVPEGGEATEVPLYGSSSGDGFDLDNPFGQ